MRGLADLADRYGSGTVRMTVWQNLIVSDIRGEDVPAVRDAIESLGLHWKATSARGGLVACTGSAGCKFAASDTKRHALLIADHLDAVLELDRPINVHVTGCPNSCAQHFLGDIGLLGTKVGDDAEEGYHVYVGGGYGGDQAIGRELFRDVLAADVPAVIERMLRGYLARRESAGEEFNDFVRRHPAERLQSWFAEPAPVNA